MIFARSELDKKSWNVFINKSYTYSVVRGRQQGQGLERDEANAGFQRADETWSRSSRRFGQGPWSGKRRRRKVCRFGKEWSADASGDRRRCARGSASILYGLIFGPLRISTGKHAGPASYTPEWPGPRSAKGTRESR